MNCKEVERIVRESLLSYLHVEPFELGCRVVLPQLDIKNDFLAVYVIESRKGIEITDFGRTMEALLAESLELDSEKRAMILQSILKQNGIMLRGDELILELPRGTWEGFREGILLFTNAMQSVHAMLHLKQPRITLDFRGLVRQYLIESEIPHEYLRSYDAPVIGQASIDFLLETHRPIAMDALHAMQSYYANSLIDRTYVKFHYLGQISSHPLRSVIFNDESALAEASDFPILNEVLDIEPIPWSEHEARFRELLQQS